MNGFDNFLINLHNPQLFRRIVNRVMSLEYGEDFTSPDDDRGDGGNDGYLTSKQRLHAVHSLKKENFEDAKILAKARSDLDKALKLSEAKTPIIQEWSFITAYRLPAHIMTALEKEVKAKGIKFLPQGPDNLAALLGKHADKMQDIPEIAVSVKIRDAKFVEDKSSDPTSNTIDTDGSLAKIPASKDDDDLRAIMAIMRKGREEVRKNRKQVKSIYYTGKTLHSRLQAGHAMLDTMLPSEVYTGEAIVLIDSLLGIARLSGDTASMAVLHAERGFYLSYQFTMLDHETSGAIELNNLIGIEPFDPKKVQEVTERLHALQDGFYGEFDEAIRLAYETADWSVLANVAMRVGKAAGQRYVHFNGLNIKERAEKEKARCRKYLDIAQNAYIILGDREGQLLVQHNLANELRFMGSKEEAKKIIELVIVEAEKNDWQDVLLPAISLQERLNEEE